MEIKQYQVGDIPFPIAIDVRDGLGRVVNCAALFTDYEVVMLDSQNNKVDLTGSSLDATAAQLGRFIFEFPATSVFNRRGDYLIQLRLSGNGAVEHTTQQTLRVRGEKGEVYR